MPQVGWVGFDPTNNLLAHNRYIRTALGRDYADVPPTRGIYRGSKESELYVAVKVSKYVDMPPLDRDMPVPEDWSILVERAQEPPSAPAQLLHWVAYPPPFAAIFNFPSMMRGTRTRGRHLGSIRRIVAEPFFNHHGI